MPDSNGVQTTVTMAPVQPHPPREEDSGNPMDLFACTLTGRFVTLPNLKVEVSARSVNTSKSFLCPSCPNSPLAIAPPQKRKDGVPFAKCLTCSWDTSECSISTMADLIDQSTTPFPWLFSQFRALKAAHNANTNGSSSFCASDTSRERQSNQRSRSLIGIQSASSRVKPLERQNDRAVTGGSAGVAFAESQSQHERKIFELYMPPSKIAPVRNAPGTRFLEVLKGEIDSDRLITPGERRANGVWLRQQVGPRQRVRRPHVTLKSRLSGSTITTKWDAADYSQNTLEYTGAYILPTVSLNILTPVPVEHNCSNHGKFIDLKVNLVNQRKFRAWVQIYNWVDREQSKEVTIDGLESKEFVFKNLKWSRSIGGHLRWLHGTCERLVQLGMNVQYEAGMEKRNSEPSELVCGHVWQVCLFGRHLFKSDEEIISRC